MKIPKWIHDRLPVFYGKYNKDIKAIMTVIKGLEADSAQQAQIQMNLLKMVKTPESKDPPKKNGKRTDNAYQ